MKSNSFKIIQAFVTLGLLAFVAYQVGLFSSEGRAQFLQVLLTANLWMLLLSLLVGVLINMSSALKWHMLVRSQDMQVGYWRLFCYYLVGQFYNLVLPTSVGGDVVRSYELGNFTAQPANALASVFVERYTGVLVLLLLSGLAVLSRLTIFNQGFVLFSLLLFSIILGLIAWMVLDNRLYQWFNKHLVSRFPILEFVFSKADKLLLSIESYKNHRSAIVWAFINSLVFYFIAVLNVYITALVFDSDVSLLDMLIATPIIMLIMNIPLSVGNLGLMEFAYITIFQLMGYSPALGLSVAVLMRLKSLFDAGMGGLLHPLFVSKRYQ